MSYDNVWRKADAIFGGDQVKQDQLVHCARPDERVNGSTSTSSPGNGVEANILSSFKSVHMGIIYQQTRPQLARTSPTLLAGQKQTQSC